MKINLISVIIPIYNVESYLNRCVQSVITQTYKNLEIILVDDGSLDQCPSMCDDWAKKDSRIKVIHKENGGLSDARNAGMKIATGEYIGFVDSDDWIDVTMYEKLYRAIQENSCNIAACGIQWVDENNNKLSSKSSNQLKYIVLQGEEAMYDVIKEKLISPTVWNKLYRAEYIKNISFAKGKTHEDVFWTYQAIHASQSIVVIPEKLYFYFQRSNSIMNTEFSLKRLDAIEAKQIRLNFIKANYPSLIGKAKREMLLFSIYIAQMSYRSTNKEIQKEVFYFINDVLKNNIPLNKERRDFRKIDLLWIYMARLSLKITCLVRNKLHIGI